MSVPIMNEITPLLMQNGIQSSPGWFSMNKNAIDDVAEIYYAREKYKLTPVVELNPRIRCQGLIGQVIVASKII